MKSHTITCGTQHQVMLRTHSIMLLARSTNGVSTTKNSAASLLSSSTGSSWTQAIVVVVVVVIATMVHICAAARSYTVSAIYILWRCIAHQRTSSVHSYISSQLILKLSTTQHMYFEWLQIIPFTAIIQNHFGAVVEGSCKLLSKSNISALIRLMDWCLSPKRFSTSSCNSLLLSNPQTVGDHPVSIA